MIDEYEGFQPGLSGPVIAGETLIPDDATDLAFATRGIYIGASGDLAVELVSGDTVLLRNVQAGILYPLRIKRVLASGTTAGDLTGVR